MTPVHFRYSEQDLVDANMAFNRASFRLPRARIWLTLLFCWFVLLVTLIGEGALWLRLLGGAAAGALMVALTILLSGMQVRRYARRNYAQQRNLSADWVAEWDAARFRMESDQGSNTVPWEDLHGWLETDGLFMLFLSERLFMMVPKAALDEAQRADLTTRLASVPPFGRRKRT